MKYLKKGRVILSNNVFSEQSNLVYRHFLCCVAYLFVFVFFYGMLNVGSYFILFYFFFLFVCFPILVN